MLAAALFFGATAAFAGDSPALKAILAVKDYASAESALKANIGSIVLNTEKATAYNYLVDLAMKQYDAQASVQLENQTQQQLGQKGDKPVDTKAMYEGAYNALVNAIECNKYDQMPNEKGKVKPKYESNNATRVWNARVQLVNAGQEASKSENSADVLKYWGAFVESDNDALFNTIDAKTRDSEKAYFGQVAYFASVYAYQAKDYARAGKLADIAMKDPDQVKGATNVKLGCMQAQLKTKADSTAFASTLQDLYAKDKKNDQVFGTLVNLLSQMGEKDKLEALLTDKESVDPNNFMVFAIRGQNAMIAEDLDKAIASFEKASSIQPDNAMVLAYLGACLFDKAQKAEDKAAGKTGRLPQAAREQIEPVYHQAEAALEKAKQLDPSHTSSNWPYPLYRAYYRLYGPNDARTVEAQKEAGVN